MEIVHTAAELRERLASRKPAFVPTMGNLHEGHIALVHKAKPLGDVTVASVFVNRLEFLPHEDFDTYPRTLEEDARKLCVAGCDVLFAPSERDLIPSRRSSSSCPIPQWPTSSKVVPARFLHRRVHRRDEAVPVRAAARRGVRRNQGRH